MRNQNEKKLLIETADTTEKKDFLNINYPVEWEKLSILDCMIFNPVTLVAILFFWT